MNENEINKVSSGELSTFFADLLNDSILIGKARICFYRPLRKLMEISNPMLTMDILLSDHLERGWINFITASDMARDKLLRLPMEADDVKGMINLFLRDNKFTFRVS